MKPEAIETIAGTTYEVWTIEGDDILMHASADTYQMAQPYMALTHDRLFVVERWLHVPYDPENLESWSRERLITAIDDLREKLRRLEEMF